MKRNIYLLLIVMIALAFIHVAGCGKTEPSPSDKLPESTGQASSPSGIQATAPSSAPSPDELTTEPSPNESAAPPAAPSTAPSSQPSTGPAADEGKDYAGLGWAILENEGLGLIMLRLGENELLYLLGEPETKSDAEIWGSDGLAHSSWSYASKGLDIGMAKLPDDTEAYVFSITATAPCTLATSRGISIGSSKDDVLKAYMGEIDPAANEDPDSWITVGSVYGGIGIGIEDSAVTYIYIGASAE